ncbi:hypothetical protein [Cellulosilyticum lentocellum]|nr:hypothetical protein [Cellulosilyticum lentocellum]
MTCCIVGSTSSSTIWSGDGFDSAIIVIVVMGYATIKVYGICQ